MVIIMLNGGLSRLEQSLDKIKKAELNAAKYILEFPDKVIQMTVSELSEASHSSASAVIRLCKNLGFSGFQDLKIRIAGDLQNKQNNGHEYQEIHADSNIANIIETVSNNNSLSINETARILDPEKIEKAAEWLNKAKRIDFYGTGASQLVAQDAQTKFMRINKFCTAYADNHLQLTSAVTLTSDDVVVAISNSGETLQIVECVKAAKESGAKTIGLTRYGNNTLGQLVDINIEIISSESDVRSAATSSRIVQLNVIDILYVAVAGNQFDSSLNYLNRSLKAIKKSFRI
ncbi:MurR/RpiR family transcriptional regulator [Terrilactibacillus laevilacticus]|uniref:MurR/RpiR family transcriptional regulator n=1 Tax=Terrilactibacillus laevilacticus TaxID=1380157 RepID=A0ABW5PN09_9BACI|nr:MurR/RpiR family transcriptional regulator [Terrilactibacillus laevilacticus]